MRRRRHRLYVYLREKIKAQKTGAMTCNFFWLENENYQLLLNWMSHIFLQQMKINNVFWIEWVIFFPTATLTWIRNLWCFYLTEKNVDLHKKNNLAKWHHYIKQDWKTYIFALILIGSFLFLTCFMFVPNDLSTKTKYIKLTKWDMDGK